MASNWYYEQHGNQQGPVSSRELKQLAASGKLLPSDLVRKEGQKTSLPAAKVKGLFPATSNSAKSTPHPQSSKKVPTPPPLPPQQSEPKSRKLLRAMGFSGVCVVFICGIVIAQFIGGSGDSNSIADVTEDYRSENNNADKPTTDRFSSSRTNTDSEFLGREVSSPAWEAAEAVTPPRRDKPDETRISGRSEAYQRAYRTYWLSGRHFGVNYHNTKLNTHQRQLYLDQFEYILAEHESNRDDMIRQTGADSSPAQTLIGACDGLQDGFASAKKGH